MSELGDAAKALLHGVGEGLAGALTWPEYEPPVVIEDWHRHWWGGEYPPFDGEYLHRAHEDLRNRFRR